MKNIFGKSKKSAQEDSQHWMGVSDLMAGLMMVFLFVSIALMNHAYEERNKIKEVAITYQTNQVAIYEALQREFEADLREWDAEIDKDTLAVRFRSPEVLFNLGDFQLKPDFQVILSDFFPRYLQVLDNFRDSISEIRIEGHTSSIWNQSTTQDDAYFNNMKLSQGRTREVLKYIYNLESVGPQRSWVRKNVAAVGYSSSRLIVNPEGTEDRERSQRVMFRVVTNAEIQIRKILDSSL